MRILRLSPICFVLMSVCVACDSFNLLNTFIAPSDSVDKRFEESQKWNQSQPQLTISSTSDSYEFFVSCDWHVVKGYTEHIERFLSVARNCPESRFILALGDFVTTKGCIPDVANATRFNPERQMRNDTVLTTVGNHDLYFNQWEDYKNHFKTACYIFIVKTPNFQDLFVILDSGNGTLGSKQIDWLKEQLENRSNYRHCIVCTHTNLFRTERTIAMAGNFPLEETAALLNIFTDNNVTIVLNGHTHCTESIRYNGVEYVNTDKLQGKNGTINFTKVTVDESINYTFSNY